jgi:WD40 repeat protein
MGVCGSQNSKQKNIKIEKKKILRYEDKDLNTERGPEGEIEPTKVKKEEVKKEEKKKQEKKGKSKRKSLIREIREGMIIPIEDEYVKKPKQKLKKKHESEQNDKFIQPKNKKEENKEEINNNKNQFYFICPNCKTRSPHIKNIYLDQNDNQLKVLYRCVCNNINDKEKESPLNMMISKNLPENKCPIHNEETLIYYCKSCKYNICNECLNTNHSDHLIKKQEIMSSEEIENLLKILSKKQIEFDCNCDIAQKQLEKDINEQIKKLNQKKEIYRKQFEHEKEKNKNVFSMIKTLYTDYQKSLSNKTHNSDGQIDTTKLNQLKYFSISDNKNNNNNNNEYFSTNIKNIISNIPNSDVPLQVTYNYNFIHSHPNNIKQYQCIENFYGHIDKIVSLIQLKNEKIVSGSYDNTIKIWNIHNLICEKTINEEGYVLSLLEFSPNMLLSGNSENKINLYNLDLPNNKENIYTFEGHKLWINCITKLNEMFFASGSNDTTIKIWDFKNRKCTSTLIGHKDCILTMILLLNKNLCSGSADTNIKIWSWESSECLFTLTGHEKWVKCLCQLNSGEILSGSDDKTIKFWKNNECVFTLKGHLNSIRSICQINNEKFASGSFDNTIKIWNIKNKICCQTLHEHLSNVIVVIKLKNGNLASCGNDNVIKIWE